MMVTKKHGIIFFLVGIVFVENVSLYSMRRIVAGSLLKNICTSSVMSKAYCHSSDSFDSKRLVQVIPSGLVGLKNPVEIDPEFEKVKRTLPDVWVAYRNNIFKQCIECLQMQDPQQNVQHLFMLLEIADKAGLAGEVLLLRGFNDWTILHQVAFGGSVGELDHVLIVAERYGIFSALVQSVDAAHGLSALQCALDSDHPDANQKWFILVKEVSRILGFSALKTIQKRDRKGVAERSALLADGGVICAGRRDD